jgi:hypothetical protein
MGQKIKENKMGWTYMVVRRNIDKTSATQLEEILWENQA